ncbi:cytoplasmic polyadenylation element-binding protein 2-like [Lytechinus pictus]|uniref:cytoplasmic polyadenylation element-binding protein 2-like n=1 Tax=Lytechinus pictus TaxID=7653 RepID=UPI0030BA21EA
MSGSSALFPGSDNLLDDGRHDQIVPSLSSPGHISPRSVDYPGERYSRKVFVGGLPPDIDEDEITASFRRFGSLVVDWPHKAESKSYFPPKGYAFLLFQDERSVQALIDACIKEEDKLYLCVSSPTIKDKPVQIRPWNLADSDFVLDGSQPLDPRKTIFVGGVPRPLRAGTYFFNISIYLGLPFFLFLSLKFHIFFYCSCISYRLLKIVEFVSCLFLHVLFQCLFLFYRIHHFILVYLLYSVMH